MNNFEKIKSIYRTSLEKNGDSPASLCWPKGRQDERFKALLQPALLLDKKSLSLCDFGCGLAHMETYIERNKLNKFDYTGFDIVPEMVNVSRDLGRNVNLIDSEDILDAKYDCIVASGIFNMKFFNDHQKNQDYILRRISMLMSSAKLYFACDFMRPDVDFIQDGSWHQPYGPLISHITKYSKDIEINMRVLPYEYTIVAYLDT